MGVVATWGTYSWSVAPDAIKTFYDYTRKTAYKSEPVEDGKNKPGTARVAPELAGITLSVPLTLDLGVNPRVELEALRAACEAGEPYPLIFGGVPATANRFLLKTVSEKDAVFGPKGQILKVTADLEFEEYVQEKEKPPVVTESASTGGGSGGGGGSKKTSAKKSPASSSYIGTSAGAGRGPVALVNSNSKTIPPAKYTGGGK